jgi:predicted metalloprotease with PDZ domain
VIDGSGGSAAGLMAGDEVLAIGGERLTRERLSSLMSSFRPGEKTSLTVSRRDKIISLEITLDTAVPENYSILPKPGFDRRDVARLQSLLGQDPGGQR